MSLRHTLRADSVFWTLMILVVLAAGTVTAYVIQQHKNTAITDADDHNALHTRAFEEHLTRSLDTIQRLADFVASESDATSLENIEELFYHILQQAPFLRSLSILDNTGRIIASSNHGNIGRRLEVEDYYPHIKPPLGTSLHFGSPWSGRDFDEGEPMIAEHPLPATGLGFVPIIYRGEHKGVDIRLAAALNPDFFINYFTQWLTVKEGFVEILRHDRVVLLTTGEPSILGAQHPDRIITQMLQESEIGHYQVGKDGQEETLTAFRVSRQYPLVVLTHLYRNRALENWRRESWRLLLQVGMGLFGVVNLAMVLYWRGKRIVSEREALRRHEYERLAATVFETVLEAVVVTDTDQRIIAVNPAFTRITGYSSEEAVGADFSLLASGYHDEAFYQTVRQSLATRSHWEGEVRNRRKTGEIFVAWLSINQVRDDTGQIIHQVTGFSDITEYCAEAERISHLAHHDLLTGLPNRALLLDRLIQGLRQAHRDCGQLALLYFDLDKFKPVNDNFGHTTGDLLLQALATRLLAEVRSTDTLARLGGDEFVVLLPVLKNDSEAITVAEKIRQAVDKPFLIDQHCISVSASIGIAFYPDNAQDEEGLIRCADSAMYRAKGHGGNRFEQFQG